MARGTNIEKTRDYNRRVVLEAIRLAGTASRTEIARRTSLSLPAISNIVQELEAEHLVVSQGRRATQRGQPPIDFALNPAGAYSIGVSIDHDYLAGVLVDLAGVPLAVERVVMDTADPRQALPEVRALIRRLRAQVPDEHSERLIGASLGLPGVVEQHRGRVLKMVRLPRWEGLEVTTSIEPEVGLPIHVANDAILAALGEQRYGHGTSRASFFYVLYAVGLGSSLVLDGRPYGGFWGHSGRLGHIPVEPRGKPCPSCGASGCLSLYTSLEVLHDHLREHGVRAASTADLEELYAARDEVLLAWLDDAARYLARAYVVLENLLAPQAVVFGGRMPAPILDHLIAAMGELNRRRSTRLRSDGPELLRSAIPVDPVAFGAAALPLHLATAASYELVLATEGRGGGAPPTAPRRAAPEGKRRG